MIFFWVKNLISLKVGFKKVGTQNLPVIFSYAIKEFA
jgi:hypothetical protein